MIHYINLFFIVFNLVLLVLLLKKRGNKITEQFFTTSSIITPERHGGENDNSGCYYVSATCLYDEKEQTKDRTDCVKNCKLVNSCTSNDCFYKCFDKNCSQWTSSACTWEPYGNTINNCTKMCIQKQGCNYTKCYNICSHCESEKDCAWYKQKVNEEDIFIKENPPVNIDPTRPLPPTIFVSVKRDGMVHIKFNPPFKIKPQTTNTTTDTTTPIIPSPEIDTSSLDTTINSFMYVIYKTQDKTGGIRVGTYTPDKSIPIKIKDYNNKPTVLPIIEFDIENLDKNTFYNIGIRSYRDTDQRISPLSNIFTIIPNKEKKHSVPKLVTDDNNSSITQHKNIQVCE